MDEMIGKWKKEEPSVKFAEILETSTDDERSSTTDQVCDTIWEEEDEIFKETKSNKGQTEIK